VAIVTTDTPLVPHQCAALARRVTLGIAHGHDRVALLRRPLPNEHMTGYRGHRVPALPRERVRAGLA
jgi:hypothetical protein